MMNAHEFFPLIDELNEKIFKRIKKLKQIQCGTINS